MNPIGISQYPQVIMGVDTSGVTAIDSGPRHYNTPWFKIHESRWGILEMNKTGQFLTLAFQRSDGMVTPLKELAVDEIGWVHYIHPLLMDFLIRFEDERVDMEELGFQCVSYVKYVHGDLSVTEQMSVHNRRSFSFCKGDGEITVVKDHSLKRSVMQFGREENNYILLPKEARDRLIDGKSD